MIRFALPFLGALALVAALAAGAYAQNQNPMPPSSPPPADTIISAGDVLTITVVGEPTLTRTVTVTSDGKVPMAFVGEVKIAGLKPAQAAARIREALGRYLREPEVTVDLVEANRAAVYGRVLRPGIYVLPPKARVLDLIQVAGGFEENADRANVRVLRKNMGISVDLAKFAATGDPQLNPELQAGDTVNVPERATIAISVLGQVVRPGPYAAPPDGTVMDAVQMAGGFTERAMRDRVMVLRGGGQIIVNLARYLEKKEPGDNPALQAGDTVTVPEKRMISATVLGQVTRPSVYQVVEGTTVAEVVMLAGGILEGTDLSLARLIHRDQRTEPVSLRAALEGGDATANVVLQDGDIISIPKPEVVRRFGVLGAVRNGGYFLMDRDRVTITTALSQAGGPMPDANLNRAMIIHTSGTQVTRTPVDLVKILKGDKKMEMVTLGPGDVLFLDNKKEALINRNNWLGLLGIIPAIIYAASRI